jgi:hypothetical protein
LEASDGFAYSLATYIVAARELDIAREALLELAGIKPGLEVGQDLNP